MDRRFAFRPVKLRESPGEAAGPGRGWYHVHTVRADPPPEAPPLEQELFPVPDEKLALVLFDIGAYRARDLSTAALERLERVLAFFKERGQDVILRVTYDTAGQGMEREPDSLEQVLRHMQALGGAVGKSRECVFLLQGIFVGSWGEMHGSKFLASGVMTKLLDAWDQATGGGFYLAVRTPAQWREAAGRTACPDLPRRLALFNDGMFGSDTDLGTYAPGTRQAELNWQREAAAYVPNGGEALSAEEGPVDYQLAVQELAKARICYLNSAYQQEVLAHWRSQRVWGRSGGSGYDAIGKRLGYRFVVREAARAGDVLEITMENQGFGSLCFPARCCLTAVCQDGARWEQTLSQVDPCNWAGETQNKIYANFPELPAPAKLFFGVRLLDGRPIPLANQGMTPDCLVCIGSIKPV